MIDVKGETIDAPAVAARVITFRNDGNLPPYIVVENLDGSASASIKYQEADDGSSWSDVSGTTATVDPGESDGQILSTATKRDIALFAGGDLKLLVHVVRQADGELSDLGTIR